MNKREVKFLIVGIILFVIDMVTKYIFFNKGMWSDHRFFHPVMNFGISFSWQLSYLIVVPLTIVALVSFVYFYNKKYFSDLVLILFVAGTLGNLYDRVVYEGVRDFIVMFDWFVYNIADVYLSVAMLLILRDFFMKNIIHRQPIS